MRSLAELIFDYSYQREWYEPIRDDFIKWYSSGYDHPAIKQALSNIDLPNRTRRAGRSAKQFDPNNPIFNAVNAFEEVRRKLSTIFDYLKGVCIILLVVSVGAIEIGLPTWVTTLFATVATISLTPPVFYKILSHQIRSNTELVRKINNKLVVMDPEVGTERRSKRLAGFYLWNKSLNRSTGIVIIVFLSVVRWLSPLVYGKVTHFLQENMVSYIDDGILKTSKRELVKQLK